MKKIYTHEQYPSDLKEIYSVICQMNKIDIRLKNRLTIYIKSRALFFGIAKKLTKHPHAALGGFLDRDHSTSMNGLTTFNNMMETDKNFREAARFALFKCCNLLEKVEEDSRDFVYLKWNDLTNEQQKEIKKLMENLLNANEEKTVKKIESYV
jgi:hypothetical protein